MTEPSIRASANSVQQVRQTLQELTSRLRSKQEEGANRYIAALEAATDLTDQLLDLLEPTKSAEPPTLSHDEEGRMKQAQRTDDTGTNVFGTATFTYDGRSYLREAVEAETGASAEPLYSSDGLLHALTRKDSGAAPEETSHLFYFAGRPVAQVVSEAAGDQWWYLTTDHLGTPVVETDEIGLELWAAPLEPFGVDSAAGLPSGALESGVFLGFPGQWDDESWTNATMGSGVYYNVHRWYAPATGRYTRPDPQRDTTIFQIYGYAEQNPVLLSDRDGLEPWPNPYVGDPYYKLGCITGSILRAATGLVGSRGPRWAHCIASCQIAKCGGESIARDLGLLKENLDTVTCLRLQRLSSLAGRLTNSIRKKQCDSAFQPEDFEDNEFGITCPVDVPCEIRCRELEGVENTAPGPFGTASGDS